VRGRGFGIKTTTHNRKAGDRDRNTYHRRERSNRDPLPDMRKLGKPEPLLITGTDRFFATGMGICAWRFNGIRVRSGQTLTKELFPVV